jgi:pilus assembly protein CpaB
MRILAFLVLGFGIALAGGGVYYVSEYLKQQSVGNVRPDLVRVLAARDALARGDLLDVDRLKWTGWPSGSVPEGAYTSAEALLGVAGDQIRYVTRSFEPGELILEGKITKPNGPPPFSFILGPDMRAVSLPIDAVSSVSGFISAGDQVDIQLIHTIDGRLISTVFLQDIEVLAIDQRADTEGVSPRLGRTATVAVTIKQAQLLTLASQTGRLSLLLRGIDASADADPAPVPAEELDGLLKPPDEEQPGIWVRKGGVLEWVPIK